MTEGMNHKSRVALARGLLAAHGSSLLLQAWIADAAGPAGLAAAWRAAPLTARA